MKRNILSVTTQPELSTSHNFRRVRTEHSAIVQWRLILAPRQQHVHFHHFPLFKTSMRQFIVPRRPPEDTRTHLMQHVRSLSTVFWTSEWKAPFTLAPEKLISMLQLKHVISTPAADINRIKVKSRNSARCTHKLIKNIWPGRVSLRMFKKSFYSWWDFWSHQFLMFGVSCECGKCDC